MLLPLLVGVLIVYFARNSLFGTIACTTSRPPVCHRQIAGHWQTLLQVVT